MSNYVPLEDTEVVQNVLAEDIIRFCQDVNDLYVKHQIYNKASLLEMNDIVAKFAKTTTDMLIQANTK